jgi:hypothetical protein
MISKYRGYEIHEESGRFFYCKSCSDYRRYCNSTWSCVVSIDEELAP